MKNSKLATLATKALETSNSMRVAFQIVAMRRKLDFGTRFQKLLDLFNRTKFCFIHIDHHPQLINPFLHFGQNYCFRLICAWKYSLRSGSYLIGQGFHLPASPLLVTILLCRKASLPTNHQAPSFSMHNAVNPHLLFALCALLWLTQDALAQDKAPALPVSSAEFPPFEYTDATGQVMGTDTEIVAQVFKRMGYQAQIRIAPWSRVEEEGQLGTIAAIFSITKTAEREQHYYFSNPINNVKDVLYKQKSNPLNWATLDDLKPLRVGISAKYQYATFFMDAIMNKKFAVEATFGASPELTNLRKLLASRFDVFICEVNVCQYLIRQAAPRFDTIDYMPQTVGPVRHFHVAFSKKWPGALALSQKFNAELAQFIKEGQRERIFEKYRFHFSIN